MWQAALLFAGVVLCDLLDAAAVSLEVESRSQIPPVRLKYDNCIVGNVTYSHDETFKLDCKTQCVCENGRHACASLCPKEMLTPPKDTRLCRSPRLVEMSGHCCKVWQCDKPSEDVNAKCRKSVSSPWTQCSESCGIGLSTRETEITRGCQKISSLRLCQNRQCASALDEKDDANGPYGSSMPHSKHVQSSGRPNYPIDSGYAHKLRKGHECRNIHRLDEARIRLGPCVSRQLYRPKMCGRCHNPNKCCVPSVSTTIQVEMLCPLNTGDPLNFMDTTRDLWDTRTIEPIDQERLQSHLISLENHFIDVQWVLKCECSHRGKSCQETPVGRAGPSITRDEVDDNRNDAMADEQTDDWYALGGSVHTGSDAAAPSFVTDEEVVVEPVVAEESDEWGRHEDNRNNKYLHFDRSNLLKRVHRT